MDKDTVQFIADTIREDVEHDGNRGRAISVEMQVLATLDYMRSPGFQTQVAATLGLSQPSISNCVDDVTKALAGKASRFIVFPTTPEASL
uniref:Transposase Helix-turn-helix domain-containing protein n=1 Tax=Ditylenchus dipsaci TaxID=166011 RepID=A0A915CKT2_9BILA